MNKRPTKPDLRDSRDVSQDDAVIGAALRGSLIVLMGLLLAGAVVAGLWLMQRVPPKNVETALELPQMRDVAAAPVPALPMADITQPAGITFVHQNGAYDDNKLLPETMGGGCAFLDYDNDDDQDLLLVNSNYWPWDDRPHGDTPTTALYSNDGLGNFADVSLQAGLAISCYGMGAAVGDFDNDGDSDIYLTAVGPNLLLRNDDGKFVDVTAESGAAGADNAWSTSCGWLDYNNDGLLDLFVCNYVDWSREIDQGQSFKVDGIGRAYGPPRAFDGTLPYLFRNDGAGKFTDVSQAAGVQVRNPLTNKPAGKSMGLAPVDFNDDGWIDIIVANDTVQNFAFRNRGDGTFEEVGINVGVAVGRDGKPRGAMGIDAAAHRNDRSLGIVIGNFANEMTSLFIAEQPGRSFEDAAISTGLGPQTRLQLTFGVCFTDLDLDGRLDLLCANGHLEEEINKVLRSQHYRQPPQMFWNNGTGRGSEFVTVKTDKCGAAFASPMVGRGLAVADIDGDGDSDAVITASGGRPRLVRNDQQLGNHWLRVRLQGSTCNRDAIGAKITAHFDGRACSRFVMPTRSYLSQSELPVTFGLGQSPRVERLVIEWPGGAVQEQRDIEADQLLTIVEPAPAGAGPAAP